MAGVDLRLEKDILVINLLFTMSDGSAIMTVTK